MRLSVEGTQGGDQAKVDEDEHITQAHVAVGVLAAGIAPCRKDARGANRQEPPLVRQSHQHQACQHCRAEAGEGGVLDRTGAGHTGTDQAQGPHAVFVGALNAVGVVVGVVHAHLQEKRDQEGQKGVKRLEFANLVGSSRAGNNGGDGKRQGAQARAFNPLSGSGHGDSFQGLMRLQ